MLEFFNLQFWMGLVIGGVIVLRMVMPAFRTVHTSSPSYVVEDRNHGIGWVVTLAVLLFIAFVVLKAQYTELREDQKLEQKMDLDATAGVAF